MEESQFNWERPQISSEDEALVQAYVETGVPLDSLPYTDAFRDLIARAGADPDSEEACRIIYRRLLGLRKRAVLPRIYHFRPAPRRDVG